jgi:hypothetical protein
MERKQKVKGETQEMNFRSEAGNGLKEESRSPWTGSRKCTKRREQEMNFRSEQEMG